MHALSWHLKQKNRACIRKFTWHISDYNENNENTDTYACSIEQFVNVRFRNNCIPAILDKSSNCLPLHRLPL